MFDHVYDTIVNLVSHNENKTNFFITHYFTLLPIHVRLTTEVSGQHIYLLHRGHFRPKLDVNKDA